MGKFDSIKVDEDENEKDGPGLIDLDMKQFGSGAMNDPLRHAMGIRSAQDACKMRMWNSFPTLFQNTIFHGEQDASIKELRHEKPLSDRLVRSKELKDLGNSCLRAATVPEQAPAKPAGPSPEEQALTEQIHEVEESIAEKEQELRELRKKRTSLREARDQLESERTGATAERPDSYFPGEGPEWVKKLEEAVTNYEKA